jgi:hypothetical protein
VELVIRDLLGREVRTLDRGNREAGLHRVVLDGGALPTGTYFCSLRTAGGMLVRRIVLIR